jgi:MFS family permease
MLELLNKRTAGTVDRDALSAEASTPFAAKKWLTPVFLLTCCAFLYLQVFIVPDTPHVAAGDQAIYLHHAARMLDGELIYRDYDHFTTPGTDVLYAALFKLFGVRAWIPQAMLIVVGVIIAWLSLGISRQVISGLAAFLPGLLFLTLSFSSYLDATHHWYSTLAATAALAILMDRRTEGRALWAGLFWGLGACFTQSLALGTLGSALFLAWEQSQCKERWSAFLNKEAFLFAGFLAPVVAFNAYFIWKVGLKRFLYFTAVFVVKYYPADYFNNFSVYLTGRPSIHSWTNWPDLITFCFIHGLIPLIYLLFLVRWWRERKQRDKPWDRLMLVNITGLSMLAGVALAPAYSRLYVVSLPALVLFVWFLTPAFKTERVLLLLVWMVVLILAIARPIVAQTRWKAVLTLPTGETAFFEPVLYQKCKWVSERTHPSDYFFGDHLVAFTLRLRNAGRVPFLRPTDYTRPEEVQDVVQGLEEHQVRFVSWYSGLDHEAEAVLHPAGDHLAPIRSYLREHYHVAEVFSNGDQIWERNQ